MIARTCTIYNKLFNNDQEDPFNIDLFQYFVFFINTQCYKQ